MDLRGSLHRLALIFKKLTPKQGESSISHILPLNAFWLVNHILAMRDELKTLSVMGNHLHARALANQACDHS